MLKIWGRRSSSNVQALMWCVGELNLPYERTDAGFIYGVVDTARLSRHESERHRADPQGRRRSAALGDRRDPPLSREPLCAGRILARGPGCACRCRQVGGMVEAERGDEFYLAGVLARRPDARREARSGSHSRGAPHPRQDISTSRSPGSPGHPISPASISPSPTSSSATASSATSTSISSGSPRPSLRRYYDALTARPAFREHVMVSYDELRDRL